LLSLADAHQCRLIGGDTTRAAEYLHHDFGELPKDSALRRDAAQIGDDIWVSGTLGDARWHWPRTGKKSLSEADHRHAAQRMHQPTPASSALRGIAHAALDLSDGLAGDLGHISNAQVSVPRCLSINCPPGRCCSDKQ
jgi:thiamine-monophosphate kinase